MGKEIRVDMGNICLNGEISEETYMDEATNILKQNHESKEKALVTYIDPEGPTIVAPLIQMSKLESAVKARLLELTLGDTWSCYRPRFTPQGISPCRECDACILHEYAWDPNNKGAVE